MAEKKNEKNLYQRLIEVRKAITYAQKSAQGYKFQYTTEGQLLGAIRPKMDEEGVFLEMQMNRLEEVKCAHVGEKGVVTEIPGLKAHFTFKWINVDDPQDVIIGMLIVQDAGSTAKTVGSLMTYANRYFLMKFFSVPTDKMDPDAFENSLDRVIATPEPLISPQQLKFLEDLIGPGKDLLRKVLETCQIDRLEEMEAKVYDSVVKRLKITKGQND